MQVNNNLKLNKSYDLLMKTHAISIQFLVSQVWGEARVSYSESFSQFPLSHRIKSYVPQQGYIWGTRRKYTDLRRAE